MAKAFDSVTPFPDPKDDVQLEKYIQDRRVIGVRAWSSPVHFILIMTIYLRFIIV